MATGKIIVVSAPSGCGKSTIINAIINRGDTDLTFSVSATNRSPRPGEEDGVNYHFLTTEAFREAVNNHEFIEWEEVYPGGYYGTLRSEVNRLVNMGRNVVLDIDVKGAINVKNIYGNIARTIFIMPPSIDELRRRLVGRGTDSPEVIETRVSRAEYELSLAEQLDFCITNDVLEKAINDTHCLIKEFIS